MINSSHMKVDFNKHIWEGWTVGDFIEELHLPIGIIMLGKAIRPPFTDKDDLAQWCKSHQPYYKKPIPEVNEYFARMYGL